MQKLLRYCCSFLLLASVNASATINVGDIAVIGFNCDGGSGLDKDFAVVTLAAIPNGETFYITDRGISGGTFNNSFTSEGTITFSVTTTIPEGTVIMFTVTSGSSPSVTANPASYGSIGVSGWTATIPGNSPWSGIGDQILIYQSGPTFIFGFNNSSYAAASSNGWHTGSNTSISFSNIPPGLTNGTNAIGFVGASHIDNLFYSGTKIGDKATLLAAITNSSNWTSDDNNAYNLSPGGTSFSGTNPIFVLGTLPVHLISFTGIVTSSGNELTWQVENEIYFSYYEIEVSADAVTFGSIGRVPAAGESHYHFTHTMAGGTRNYYRLKMTDIDGRYTYSKVIMLINTGDARNVILYPNPVYTTLNINSRDRIKNIRLTDGTGSYILYTEVNRSTTSLDMQQLPPGLYYVHVNIADRTIIKKIVKAK